MAVNTQNRKSTNGKYTSTHTSVPTTTKPLAELKQPATSTAKPKVNAPSGSAKTLWAEWMKANALTLCAIAISILSVGAAFRANQISDAVRADSLNQKVADRIERQ